MNLDQYQSECMRSAKPLDFEAALMHAALGVCSEAGEMCTPIKRHTCYGVPLDAAHVVEECGDGLWFTAYAARTLGAKLSSVATLRQVKVPPSALPQAGLRAVASASDIAMAVLTSASVFGREGRLLAALSLHLEQLDHVLHLVGSTLDEAMTRNIAKLRARYPEAYSDAAALARADKANEVLNASLAARTYKLEPLPDLGDHRTLIDFKKDVELGLFNDYDGSGCYATAEAMSDVDFSPSELLANPRNEFTHVVWFNK